MVKRALLIASQTAGLRGCDGDVALMSDALARWDFACTSLTDGAATQAGILTAYRSLIDQAQAGDSVVVYYSGHGGRIRDLTSVNETTNAYFQFIVPTDYEDSTNDDFRGILADELRALQLELTTRTDNVTTILDCCHSALMSHDPALVARFLQRPWAELQRGARARQEHASADVRRVLRAPGNRARRLREQPARRPHGGLFAYRVGIRTAQRAIRRSARTVHRGSRRRPQSARAER